MASNGKSSLIGILLKADWINIEISIDFTENPRLRTLLANHLISMPNEQITALFEDIPGYTITALSGLHVDHVADGLPDQ